MTYEYIDVDTAPRTTPTTRGWEAPTVVYPLPQDHGRARHEERMDAIAESEYVPFTTAGNESSSLVYARTMIFCAARVLRDSHTLQYWSPRKEAADMAMRYAEYYGPDPDYANGQDFDDRFAGKHYDVGEFAKDYAENVEDIPSWIIERDLFDWDEYESQLMNDHTSLQLTTDSDEIFFRGI